MYSICIHLVLLYIAMLDSLVYIYKYILMLQALQEMLSLLKSYTISSEVTGSVLLTVAELSSSLGPQLIPLLPVTLKPVLSCLAEEEEGEREGGSVCVMVKTATVTTLRVIVQTLPKFLSSFAVTIITEVRGTNFKVGGPIMYCFTSPPLPSRVVMSN